MTLEELLKNYGGGAGLTLKKYCEEEEFSYYTDVDDDMLGKYTTCITKCSWWNEVKDKKVVFWNVAHGERHGLELFVDLEED